MTYLQSLGLFWVLILGIIVIPGMDMLLVLSNTMARGLRSGFAALSGIIAGGAVHTIWGLLSVALILGLPPLLIQATDAEVLADDARRIAERAQAGGVEVRLEMWTGLWHVWQLFAGLVPEAGDATARMGRWLGSRLS